MSAHGVLRSLLFVPGNDSRKIAKAAGLTTDAIILDWEDAVLPTEKAAARQCTMDFLRPGRVRPYVFIRINPVGTSEFQEDLRALTDRLPDGVMLSKCRSAGDVQHVAGILDDINAEGNCSICPLVESPEGLIEAVSISQASSRVSHVAFGAEDFSAEMCLQPTADESELLFARSSLVTACRAAKKEPIDSPCLDVRDLSALRTSAQRARNLGFSGKLAIHPNQVDILNEAFTPTEAELSRARELVKSFHAERAGAMVVHGRMVDEAVVRNAQRLLELYDRSVNY